jgi:hypothetical protein
MCAVTSSLIASLVPDVRTFLESPYFKDTLLLALVFLNDLITKVRGLGGWV